MKFSQVVESLNCGHEITRPSESRLTWFVFGGYLYCRNGGLEFPGRLTAQDLAAQDWDIGHLHREGEDTDVDAA